MAEFTDGSEAKAESGADVTVVDARPAFRGVHHTGISTPDLDRLVAFYRDMFGFQEVERLAWVERDDVDTLQGLSGSAGTTAMIRLGGTYLELFQYDTPEPEWYEGDRPVSRAGLNHICIATDDVPGAHRRLLAAGMRFHGPPVDLGDGRPIAYGRDPDGNVVEIWQIEVAGP